MQTQILYQFYIFSLSLDLKTTYTGKEEKYIVKTSEGLKPDLLFISMHFMGHYFSFNLSGLRSNFPHTLFYLLS